MKLGEFLNNIKRVGTKIQIAEFPEDVFYNGTISEFKHWIHSGEYINRIVDSIFIYDDFYQIVLEEE